MNQFGYKIAETLNDAIGLLDNRNLKVQPMAGGTDLIVQIRSGILDPDIIVDIKRIPEMNRVSYNPEQGLILGAAVPCFRIYEDKLTQTIYPALVDSSKIIGGVAVQGRATIGGNVCNSSPSGDFLPTLIVLKATCRIIGQNGERMVPVENFFIGPGENVLEAEELLISIHIPAPQPCSGANYLRFIPRNEMDIAVAGVGAMIALSNDLKEIASCRIALGAVAPTPILAKEAGDYLIGKKPNDKEFGHASELAMSEAQPISDMRGSISYRKHLVGVLTRRALRNSLERAYMNQKED